MKNIFKTVLLLSFFTLASCDNVMVKKFGGTMTVEIEKDQKLVNCSWKSSKETGTSLWLLTRVRKEGEQPDTFKYFEKSTLGVFEGTVTIVEK